MKYNKKTTKQKIPFMVLSTAMVASSFSMVGASAMDLGHSLTSVTNTTDVTVEGFVRPDKPITLTVQADKELIQKDVEKGNSGKSRIGVLIVNGENSFLATPENGTLAVHVDGSTISLEADHQEFDRYSNYNVYVLVGNALNKYNAMLKSGGHAKSFETIGNDAYGNSVQIKTGSAIGEATKATVELEAKKVSVKETGRLIVKATDDYGSPATDATVKVTGKGTGNAKVASTFIAPEPIQMKDGTVTIPLSDHSANTVKLSVSVEDNQYSKEANPLTFTAEQVFEHGEATSAQIELPEELKAGQEAEITGELEDEYGNPADHEPLTFEGALEGIVTSDENGNLSGSVNVVSSGAVSANVNGLQVQLQNKNGVPFSEIKTTSATASVSYGIAGQNIGLDTQIMGRSFGTVMDNQGRITVIHEKGIYTVDENRKWTKQADMPSFYNGNNYYYSTYSTFQYVHGTYDESGHLVIAITDPKNTKYQVLLRLNGSEWEEVGRFLTSYYDSAKRTWVTHGGVRTMISDKEDNIYIGTGSGYVLKLQTNGEIQDLGRLNPWTSMPVYSLAFNSKGELYAGGYYASKYVDGKWVSLPGFSRSATQPTYVAIGSNDEVYVAHRNKILKYVDDKLAVSEILYDRSSNYPYGLVVGENNKVYVLNDNGLLREYDENLNLLKNITTNYSSFGTNLSYSSHSPDKNLFVNGAGEIVQHQMVYTWYRGGTNHPVVFVYKPQ